MFSKPLYLNYFQLMKEMQCTPSCHFNKYIVREMFSATFDTLVYQYGEDAYDGANFEVKSRENGSLALYYTRGASYSS